MMRIRIQFYNCLLFLFFPLGTMSCVAPVGLDTAVNGVAYELTADCGILYSDERGELSHISRLGEVKKIMSSRSGISSLSASKNGNCIALSEYPDNVQDEMRISIFFATNGDQQSFVLRESFFGSMPAFSGDGDSIFYCRPTRFVGSFWTDFEIWKYSLASKGHTRVSNEVFFSVNGIAVNDSSEEVLLSGIKSGGTGEASESLFKFSRGMQIPIASAKAARVLTPAFTRDFKNLLYVSDQRKPYHYEVVSEELGAGHLTFLTDGSEMRYATNPKQDCEGNTYFLGATEFVNGRPKLRLYRIPDQDNSIELVPIQKTIEDLKNVVTESSTSETEK